MSARFFEAVSAGGGTVGLRFERHALAISGIAADGLAAKHPCLLAVGLRLSAAQGITIAEPVAGAQVHPQYEEVVATISTAAGHSPCGSGQPSARLRSLLV